MDIFFENNKLARECSESKLCVKAHGSKLALKIMQRLAELLAADNLGQISYLPPQWCHELKGNRKGQFSVFLNQNFRLIFEIANNPIPRKADGSVDREKVTQITILKAKEDYHGK